jgi:protein-S-isoprenylcysteine O-methyltransferase Ste14
MPRIAIRQIVGGLIITSVGGAIIFAAAGTIDLPFVWAWLAIMLACILFSAIALPPDLLRERQQPGTEGRVHDHHRTLVVPLFILSWVLAGLDLGRFHWSDTIPTWLRIAGLAGYAAAMSLMLWAMCTNRFFSAVIRLQRDRDHQTITGGPYRFVRHPGYAGMIAALLFEGLALGSWIALAPVVVIVLLFVRRTINEDTMLQRDLAGYADYAARVRSRLVPGVW